MSRKILIAPSLLAADFAHLEREIHRVEEAGADMLHLDIMDGHFVPNLTFGPPIVEKLRKITPLHFDVHLMLDNPEAFLTPFVNAGADGLTIHLEIHPDPSAILDRIGAMGKVRGLSLNPDMPIDRLGGKLGKVDRLLVMSVFPGFGGQSFIPESLERIRQARQLMDREAPAGAELQVDGGIYVENAKAIVAAGASNLVVGTGTFRAPDMKAAVRDLRAAGQAVQS